MAFLTGTELEEQLPRRKKKKHDVSAPFPLPGLPDEELEDAPKKDPVASLLDDIQPKRDDDEEDLWAMIHRVDRKMKGEIEVYKGIRATVNQMQQEDRDLRRMKAPAEKALSRNASAPFLARKSDWSAIGHGAEGFQQLAPPELKKSRGAPLRSLAPSGSAAELRPPRALQPKPPPVALLKRSQSLTTLPR
jgi:hypothetical protein